MADRNTVIFSVTTENCNTSPVFNSVFDRRIDRMNPPNSAPSTSRGMPLPSMLSTAIPSRPIRLMASVPSTRSRIPWSTCLNDTPLLPLLHLGQPLFQSDDLRIALPGRCKRIEFLTDLAIAGVARQEIFVDRARLVGETLLHVEIGHRLGRRHILLGGFLRPLGGSKNIGCRFFFAPRRRNFRGRRRGLDMDPLRRLDGDGLGRRSRRRL